MIQGEVRALVIQSLSEKKRRPAAELEAEMLLSGPECPYDSVWLVKAGVRAGRRMGLKLKPTPSDASAFKSVEALTGYLCRVAQQQDVA